MVRRYGEEFRARYRPLPEQRRVLWAIENCQSAVLGGHWMHCEGCAREHRGRRGPWAMARGSPHTG